MKLPGFISSTFRQTLSHGRTHQADIEHENRGHGFVEMMISSTTARCYTPRNSPKKISRAGAPN
jgi:hypothetical protein